VFVLLELLRGGPGGRRIRSTMQRPIRARSPLGASCHFGEREDSERLSCAVPLCPDLYRKCRSGVHKQVLDLPRSSVGNSI